MLGHASVSILDGGWRGWQEPNAPVQAGPAPGGGIHARYDPALRAELGEVEQAVRTASEALVDARPRSQWQGTSKTSAVQGYGHLPGAVWVDQSEALTPEGSLKPRPDLPPCSPGWAVSRRRPIATRATSPRPTGSCCPKCSAGPGPSSTTAPCRNGPRIGRPLERLGVAAMGFLDAVRPLAAGAGVSEPP